MTERCPPAVRLTASRVVHLLVLALLALVSVLPIAADAVAQQAEAASITQATAMGVPANGNR